MYVTILHVSIHTSPSRGLWRYLVNRRRCARLRSHLNQEVPRGAVQESRKYHRDGRRVRGAGKLAPWNFQQLGAILSVLLRTTASASSMPPPGGPMAFAAEGQLLKCPCCGLAGHHAAPCPSKCDGCARKAAQATVAASASSRARSRRWSTTPSAGRFCSRSSSASSVPTTRSSRPRSALRRSTSSQHHLVLECAQSRDHGRYGLGAAATLPPQARCPRRNLSG